MNTLNTKLLKVKNDKYKKIRIRKKQKKQNKTPLKRLALKVAVL